MAALVSACIAPIADDEADAYAWDDEDGDKAFGVPAWLEARSLSASFVLPPDTWLYKSTLVDVYTELQTDVRLTATPQSLTISAPFFIDVLGPINEKLDDISYDFASGKVTVTYLSSEFGGLNWQSAIQNKMQAMVSDAVAGTRMAVKGYNPALDPNIAETLSQIAGSFLDESKSGGRNSSLPFDLKKADQLGVQVIFWVKTDKEIKENGTDGVRLRANHYLSIESNNRFYWPAGSNLQAVLDAREPGEFVKALGIERLRVKSYTLTGAQDHRYPDRNTGIEVLSKGKPIALLQDSVIDGDAIELHTWFLSGEALSAAVTEKAVLGLFFGRDPRTAEVRATTRGGIVRGLVADKLENGLSVAVRRLIYKHRQALPGIDLPTALRMSPPPPKVVSP